MEVELQYIAPSLKPEDPAFWDTTKRCVRCTKFYTERENTGCWYHPGKYKTPLHAAEGSLVGWSCCRSIPDESWLQSSDGEAYFHNVNQEALKLDGKGCTHTEKHLEDKAFSASLAQFPVQQTVTPVSTTATTTKKEEPEPELQDEEREGFFIHPVSINETLVGIALKYKTTTAELRRINRLTTDSQLFGKKSIYIPKKGDVQGPIPAAPLSEEQKMRHAINNVKLKTGCSTEEAKWYLADHDNDVDKAVAQWKEDKKWEQRSGEKGPMTRSVPHRSQSVPSTTSLSKSFTSSTPIGTRASKGNDSPKEEGRPSSLLEDFMSYFK